MLTTITTYLLEPAIFPEEGSYAKSRRWRQGKFSDLFCYRVKIVTRNAAILVGVHRI
jgi:hypothetical protein